MVCVEGGGLWADSDRIVGKEVASGVGVGGGGPPP